MKILPDDEVIQIAERVAAENGVSLSHVLTSPTVDSIGGPAIEVRLVLTHGSSDAIKGKRSAQTVSDLIRELTDKGEERSPLVRYEEEVVAKP